MPLSRLQIDPDIRRARTLPSAVYRERGYWELQRESLFPRTWHACPDPCLPARAGELLPWTLLDGCLGEPLLLARDDAQELRLLSNVCTHRGTVLVDERCQVRGIRCRYHGRRFALDGRVLSMPEFEQVEGFPGPQDDLPRVPQRSFAGLLLASLRPREGLDDVVRRLEEAIGFLPLATLRPDPASRRTYEFEANWALYCDNYLEGFHVPSVHPTLRSALDYSAYETRLFPGGVLQVGIANPGQPCFALPEGHPEHGRAVAAYYAWLFPCTMLNFYPWGMSVNVVLPQGPTRTRVVFFSFVLDESKREQGAGAGLDRVQAEDEGVVVAVQRGVQARLYERGRYSPTREQGVHHFHRMLAEWLGDG